MAGVLRKKYSQWNFDCYVLIGGSAGMIGSPNPSIACKARISGIYCFELD